MCIRDSIGEGASQRTSLIAALAQYINILKYNILEYLDTVLV